MSKVNVVYVNGLLHSETVEMLTRMKLIQSIPYKSGYLCARYGVNKSTIKNEAKRLDGEK